MENKTEKKELKEKVNCNDPLCPFHGLRKRKLKTHGRVFKGEVIRKLKRRVTIMFERVLYVPKYERYEKRRTKIHARLPDCLDDVMIGDTVQIEETRPISKTIHFVVTKIVKKAEEK